MHIRREQLVQFAVVTFYGCDHSLVALAHFGGNGGDALNIQPHYLDRTAFQVAVDIVKLCKAFRWPTGRELQLPAAS